MHEHRQSRGYRPLSVCVVAVLLQARDRAVSVMSTSSASCLPSPHHLFAALDEMVFVRWPREVGGI